jgi:hypothetical protein
LNFLIITDLGCGFPVAPKGQQAWPPHAGAPSPGREAAAPLVDASPGLPGQCTQTSPQSYSRGREVLAELRARRRRWYSPIERKHRAVWLVVRIRLMWCKACCLRLSRMRFFFSKGMNNNDILGFSLSPYNPATSIHIPKKNIFLKKERNIGNGTNWLLQFPIFNGRALRIEHTTFSTNFWWSGIAPTFSPRLLPVISRWWSSSRDFLFLRKSQVGFQSDASLQNIILLCFCIFCSRKKRRKKELNEEMARPLGILLAKYHFIMLLCITEYFIGRSQCGDHHLLT